MATVWLAHLTSLQTAKMTCSPTYSYRPEFTPGDQKCDTPLYQELRARSGLIKDHTHTPTDPTDVQGLFVRSRNVGYENNDVTIEETGTQFLVRFQSTIVETYNLASYTTTDKLRHALDVANSIVEMPPLHIDIYDIERTTESTTHFSFDEQHLQGGAGGPTNNVTLASVRTGPERSIIMITTTEDYEGNPVTTPLDRRTRQWNGFRWVTYSNTIPNACPFEGTS